MRFSLSLLLATLILPLAAPAQESPGLGPIDIPVAIGQSVKEIRVPHHNAQGKLSLRLNAERAERSSSSEFTFGDLRLSYVQVLRTKEFEGQDEASLFGAFSAGYRF